MKKSMSLIQKTIFNRVMKHSFYYPAAAALNEQNSNFSIDSVRPFSGTTFFTEYFPGNYISSDSLDAFIEKVYLAISRLSAAQTSKFLEEAVEFSERERLHLERTGVTIEEQYNFFHTTRPVSQLLRYRAAFGRLA
jgi:hypothetical protein